jgi:hypothetical protein
VTEQVAPYIKPVRKRSGWNSLFAREGGDARMKIMSSHVAVRCIAMTTDDVCLSIEVALLWLQDFESGVNTIGRNPGHSNVIDQYF